MESLNTLNNAMTEIMLMGMVVIQYVLLKPTLTVIILQTILVPCVEMVSGKQQELILRLAMMEILFLETDAHLIVRL